MLAENTDGRAIVNRNDLAAGMKQIIRDSSAYYLLGYNSTQAPTDGKFHEIKVRVKRPGVQVRARKGYWAFTAEDVKRAVARAASPGRRPKSTKALATIAPMTNRRYIRTWIGNDKGRGRADAGDAAVGAAAADAGREARRAAARHGARDLAVRRHRLSRPGADGAGGAGQRRHRSASTRRPASSICA